MSHPRRSFLKSALLSAVPGLPVAAADRASDAHHGDGVFYSFEDDPDLIFADIHQDGNAEQPENMRLESMQRHKKPKTKISMS